MLIKVKIDKEKKKIKNKKKNRNTHFCIGICETWSGANSIHVTLKKLRNKCDLKWLRMSMSYHKFSNLNEIFQGDLNNKLMKNITSRDFMDLNCNCNRGSKIDGECICGKECRKSIVVHKATCNDCGCTTLETPNKN